MVVDRRAREYGLVMAEQAGLSIGAIRERQVALSRWQAAAAHADRALAEALASAHAATVDGVGRIDAIAAEIDRAVENQVALGIDTATGAREFQKFLVAKQREICAVVSDAHELAAVKKAMLENLFQHYTASAS
jgi:UDP-N-acetyl-D-mannosaminuronic acid transferase (WecB/TagA/CpsF family)